MRSEVRRAAVAVALMVVAAFVGSYLMVPTTKIVKSIGVLDVEGVLPKEFGDWVMLPSAGMIVNPQLEETVRKVYSQDVARTYANKRTSEVVMLTVAYGEDQRDSSQVHLPEICYPAQGFQVQTRKLDSLTLPSGPLPIRRLETVAHETMFEPVSYWIVVGNHHSLGGLQKKLIELSYGVQGLIPDGLLFRVSTRTAGSKNSEAGFAAQNRFVRDLYEQVSVPARQRLFGLN